MRQALAISFICFNLLALQGCVSSTSTSTASTNSEEVEARKQTNQLRQLLSLSDNQTDKVYIATLTHIKTTNRLTQLGESSKVAAADEAYRQELSKILTNDQWGQYRSIKGN